MGAAIKVLCVEDEPDLRENLQDYLALEGYQVDIAENGISAIEHIESRDVIYDAIICDINMSGLNGLEFLRTLRHNYRHYQNVPFIFLTGQKDRESQLRANQLGCDHYLSKPVDMELLSTVIRGRLARADSVKEAIQEEQLSYQNFLLQSLSDEMLEPTNGMITLGMMFKNALSEEPSADSQHNFEQLQKQAMNQLSVIQQMMSLLSHRAISESGFYKTMLSAQALVEQIEKDLLSNGFPERTLSINCDAPDMRIQCNTQMIAQLVNALLFPRLFIYKDTCAAHVQCHAAKEGYLTLTIADNTALISETASMQQITSHHDVQTYCSNAKHRTIPLLYALYVAEMHKAVLFINENDAGDIAVSLQIPT